MALWDDVVQQLACFTMYNNVVAVRACSNNVVVDNTATSGQIRKTPQSLSARLSTSAMPANPGLIDPEFTQPLW